jgi:hypothetical protein
MGTGAQADNPGHEITNGAIPAGGSVTITITATILASAAGETAPRASGRAPLFRPPAGQRTFPGPRSTSHLVFISNAAAGGAAATALP